MNMAREGTTPPFASDRELVLAFQQGRSDAYEEMYRLYEPRIRRVCARMLKNPQDVEEATQEAFLKAYQALGRFNGRYQLGAWLARIASNVCLDQIRSRSRAGTQIALTAEHESAGSERGPEEIVVGEDPRVFDTIADIQPLHARALKLRALGGLSHVEMAGRLEMSPAQVKALLHRARSSFRRAWDKAEGWALAPIAGIRGFFSNRSSASEASTNLLGFTPSLSPLLAERVAASAVIVAVALSGAPSQPVDSGVAVRVPAIAAEPAGGPKPPSTLAARKGARPARSFVAAAEPSTMEGRSRGPITKVLEAVGEQDANLGEKKPDKPGPSDGDPGGLGSAGGAHTKPVMRKLRQVVDDLTQGD